MLGERILIYMYSKNFKSLHTVIISLQDFLYNLGLLLFLPQTSITNIFSHVDKHLNKFLWTYCYFPTHFGLYTHLSVHQKLTVAVPPPPLQFWYVHPPVCPSEEVDYCYLSPPPTILVCTPTCLSIRSSGLLLSLSPPLQLWYVDPPVCPSELSIL